MTNKLTLKINIIAIIIFALLTTILSVGYSILSEKLEIKTNVLVSATQDIRISSMSNISSLNGAYEVNANKYTKTTFNVSIGLKNINSVASYSLTIKNFGNTSMQIKSINITGYDNQNIIYTLEGIEVGSTFLKGEAKNFVVTFKYKENNLSASEILNALFELEFSEYIPVIKEYIPGMILDLRGEDSPSNNIWYDRINKKALRLISTIYNNQSKYYDFSQDGAYGTINESIIPLTGDFTLEAFIRLPSNFDSSTDEAIVSQVNDLKNDTGRIKFNLAGSELITFHNRQFPTNTNLFYKFSSSLIATKNYSLQLVRIADSLNLYLNGNLVSTNEYLSTNTISPGSFKIARWNEADIQQYHGGVYAVRVYDKPLTAEELRSNYLIDVDKYVPTRVHYNTLREYAVGEQITGSNDGLYLDNQAKFVYRGLNVNNYLKINGSSDVYRIISYNEDDTMKIINQSFKINKAFDASGNRDSLSSSYCDYSSKIVVEDQYYGCNAWNKSEKFTNNYMNGNVLIDASLNTYFNDTYYNQLNSKVKAKIIKHDFNTGVGVSGLNRDEQNTQSMVTKWQGYIGLLSIADVLNASLTPLTLTSSQIKASNYLLVLSGAKEILWTMTADNINTYDVFVIAQGNMIGKRRASRVNQVTGDTTYTMYAMPSFYIRSDVSFTGTGTIDDPFIIN